MIDITAKGWNEREAVTFTKEGLHVRIRMLYSFLRKKIKKQIFFV